MTQNQDIIQNMAQNLEKVTDEKIEATISFTNVPLLYPTTKDKKPWVCPDCGYEHIAGKPLYAACVNCISEGI